MNKLVSILLFSLFFVAALGLNDLQAQRVSLTANVSGFNIDRVSSVGTDIDYQGSTSLSANLRIYTKKKWAIRLGAGLDQLNYTVGDGINSDYDAKRKDIKGILGIEKHFVIANFVDVYPGLFVPVTVVGEDLIDDNYKNIQNGNLRAGLGAVLGANVKLFKILRLGVEFDATFDDFKEGVVKGVEEVSFVPISGINYKTAVTLGIAF